jgi:hypothetical protein
LLSGVRMSAECRVWTDNQGCELLGRGGMGGR